MKEIKGFIGQYNFLSNFYPFPMNYAGIHFYHSEGAYQASKCRHGTDADTIALMVSPTKAKQTGKALQRIHPDWDSMRLSTMESILRIKFSLDNLGLYLLCTGDAYLEETNHWNDTFWGVCRGKGENHLGKILMKIREELQTQILSDRVGAFFIKEEKGMKAVVVKKSEKAFTPFSLKIDFETAEEAAMFDNLFYTCAVERSLSRGMCVAINKALDKVVPCDEVWSKADTKMREFIT